MNYKVNLYNVLKQYRNNTVSLPIQYKGTDGNKK